MAILAIHTGKITKDMYEKIGKDVNWESNAPPGVIFIQDHLMTPATFVLQKFGNQRINGAIF